MIGPNCPHWCTGEHDLDIHASQGQVHGGVSVRLLQPYLSPEPRIWVSHADIPVSEAGTWAHVFAMLGQPELAATVKRLGELAEAGAVYSQPHVWDSGCGCDTCRNTADGIRAYRRDHGLNPDDLGCTIGATPGALMDPVSHKIGHLPLSTQIDVLAGGGVL